MVVFPYISNREYESGDTLDSSSGTSLIDDFEQNPVEGPSRTFRPRNTNKEIQTTNNNILSPR